MTARLRDYFIALFLFSIVIAAGNNYMLEMVTEHNQTTDNMGSLSQASRLNQSIQRLESSKTNMTGVFFVDVALSGVKGLINFADVVQEELQIFKDVVSALTEYILPVETEAAPYVTLILGAITIAILFEVVGVIVNRRI